jgi:hypothetical protein
MKKKKIMAIRQDKNMKNIRASFLWAARAYLWR